MITCFSTPTGRTRTTNICTSGWWLTSLATTSSSARPSTSPNCSPTAAWTSTTTSSRRSVHLLDSRGPTIHTLRTTRNGNRSLLLRAVNVIRRLKNFREGRALSIYIYILDARARVCVIDVSPDAKWSRAHYLMAGGSLVYALKESSFWGS